MDARRLRLYELLKPKLGEEVAKELVLQLPAEPGTVLLASTAAWASAILG